MSGLPPRLYRRYASMGRDADEMLYEAQRLEGVIRDDSYRKIVLLCEADAERKRRRGLMKSGRGGVNREIDDEEAGENRVIRKNWSYRK